MPFAGYKDFADCVRRNRDRKNPEAYCAAIMRRVEGKMADFGVVKADTARQLVFGWASIAIWKDGTPVLDSQGDLVRPEELEDAAYGFVVKFREMNERHMEEVKGTLVESFVSTPEKLEKMGLPPDALPTGWWVGFYVAEPTVFAKVLSGEYAMFSIEGTAERVPV